MAKRMYFISTPTNARCFEEKLCEFTYYNGFSISQKQKSISSFHNAIKEIDPSLKVLEVSTKSTVPFGVALSAFNLKYYDSSSDKIFAIENVFQSSKVFEHGGPYRDLLYAHPREAKRDERLTNSGKLLHFDFADKIWTLEPKSMFYDWIYINALLRDTALSEAILEYNAFTDIEFNHDKSINCQARAAAVFVSMKYMDKTKEVLEDINKFKQIYSYSQVGNTQMTFL